MLELQDESGRLRLANAITTLQCEIELPESWSDFFDISGMAASSEFDNRRAARWKNRVLAGLLYRTTFSVLPRSEGWHPIYIKDLSHSGAAFIHSEQLYPLERMRILMIDDRSSRLLQNDCLRTAEVVWCRRVQDKCFEVGARFID
jgi:PilZ domain-containing protein